MAVKHLLWGAASGLLLLSSGNAMAVKARPGIIDYTQPDGTVIQIMLHGDEKCRYATLPDGTLLSLNERGAYEKAGLRSVSQVAESPLRYSSIPTRSAQGAKYRYSSSAFPTTGNPHSLVVLVEYQDYRFNVENPLEYFEEFLNGDNFTRDGGTGSCRQFYAENSSGAFVPTFDVYGPVLLQNNRRFYGGGSEENACMMVVEAVMALDGEVDFSQYDHNEDGYVDSIYIIYADKGQNDGGPPESVWPYSWELEEENVTLIADGVKFNTYGCSNEIMRDGRMNGIGTFTHEFGHVLGLPDLYNTGTSWDLTTPCEWSTMDSGNYNNDSRTPVNFSAFERYSLGWLTPSEIVESREYTLRPLHESNRAYMMTTEENPDEFFILEYRTAEGWDRYLPAEGMLAWRCEFVQKVWDTNSVNNVMSHQYVELIRADNEKTATAESYRGDPFPGSKGVTEFSRYTEPALKSWYSERTMNAESVSGIREEGGAVFFRATVTENRVPAAVDKVDERAGIRKRGDTLIIESGKASVYDISGRFVGVVTPDAPLRLRKGVYVAGGQKIVI